VVNSRNRSAIHAQHGVARGLRAEGTPVGRPGIRPYVHRSLGDFALGEQPVTTPVAANLFASTRERERARVPEWDQLRGKRARVVGHLPVRQRAVIVGFGHHDFGLESNGARRMRRF
jgi:hypothetical protein